MPKATTAQLLDHHATLSAVPTVEQIRARAYQLYCARGQQAGRAMDDWLQAEYELLQLPVRKLVEFSSPPTRPRNSRQLAVVKLAQAALLLGSGLDTWMRR